MSIFGVEALHPINDQEKQVVRLAAGHILDSEAQAIADLAARVSIPPSLPHFRYSVGARLRKIKGSSWQGCVVGFYSTTLTPIGYAIESERELGSVQIYPESALEVVP